MLTYGELYRAVKNWAARHVAQDLLLMYGGDRVASEEDISRVVEIDEWETQHPGMVWKPWETSVNV
jgi:hypothetical protein